ncbi:hypothetical protein [Algoriphagus terrigena]|uniref:hypothetical protein n=1 Tax=Algoriphagus terrigena TaxID=344884 RepID=UPI000423DD49|nr:hypothetical protein [Algoriphagus terrigena]
MYKRSIFKPAFFLFLISATTSTVLHAQEESAASAANAQELSDKLANPVASLISVPLQNNMTYGIGPYNGSKYVINVQPVIPFSISEDLNLITRFIVPIVDQRDVTKENSSEFGVSDATITAFFSPKHSKAFTWGAGPAFLVPTATNEFLGTEKFGIGPSALMLKQFEGKTIGFIANQIWSVAGNSDRADVSQFYIQAFFNKSFKSGAGLGANFEITQNWEGNTTTITLNAPSVSAVTKLGNQAVQLAIMPMIPLSGPSGSKADWGLRTVLAFVFPN